MPCPGINAPRARCKLLAALLFALEEFCSIGFVEERFVWMFCRCGINYINEKQAQWHLIMPDQAFSEMLGILEIFSLKKCCLSDKEQALTFCIEIFFSSRYSVVRIIMRTIQTKASNFCSLHKFHFDHHLHI